MKRSSIWLAAVAGTALLAVPVYDRLLGVAWVGRADLRIVFVVVDARTDEAINGAKIKVSQEMGGFCSDKAVKQFEMLTDESGSASRTCRDCMSFGTQSGLKFTDTFSAHTPKWLVRIVAEGYVESDEIYVGEPVYRQQLKRIGPGAAEMVVRVALSPS